MHEAMFNYNSLNKLPYSPTKLAIQFLCVQKSTVEQIVVIFSRSWFPMETGQAVLMKATSVSR